MALYRSTSYRSNGPLTAVEFCRNGFFYWLLQIWLVYHTVLYNLFFFCEIMRADTKQTYITSFRKIQYAGCSCHQSENESGSCFFLVCWFQQAVTKVNCNAGPNWFLVGSCKNGVRANASIETRSQKTFPTKNRSACKLWVIGKEVVS